MTGWPDGSEPALSSRPGLDRVGDEASPASRLAELFADIDTRVRAIQGENPQWPCRKGCDGCCRRLAEPPRLSEAEWLLSWEGLKESPAARRAEVIARAEALDTLTARPIVCPLLDLATSACLIYAHRPAACRTYGFYVQRGAGLYCRDIEALAASGEGTEIIWGNHDAVDRRLDQLGARRSLGEWLRDWRRNDAP